MSKISFPTLDTIFILWYYIFATKKERDTTLSVADRLKRAANRNVEIQQI